MAWKVDVGITTPGWDLESVGPQCLREEKLGKKGTSGQGRQGLKRNTPT